MMFDAGRDIVMKTVNTPVFLGTFESVKELISVGDKATDGDRALLLAKNKMIKVVYHKGSWNKVYLKKVT